MFSQHRSKIASVLDYIGTLRPPRSAEILVKNRAGKMVSNKEGVIESTLKTVCLPELQCLGKSHCNKNQINRKISQCHYRNI